MKLAEPVPFHSHGNLNEVRDRYPVQTYLYQWGLVAGRTQTYLHWYTRYSPELEPQPRN